MLKVSLYSDNKRNHNFSVKFLCLTIIYIYEKLNRRLVKTVLIYFYEKLELANTCS